MLAGIKNKFGNYILNKEVKKVVRDKKIINLGEAKTIGILYHFDNEANYDVVCNFVKVLQSDHKTVKALGFVNDTKVPSYCYPRMDFDFFTTKDINWFQRPKNQFIYNFINLNYDLIIDLSIEDCYPLQYISGLSKGKFKIGCYGKNRVELYDFMFNLENQKNIQIADYLQHIIHYLNLINTHPKDRKTVI